ncbi:adenylate cyclase type 10-like [Tachyglossus aculeatus]|uniref:adenylate cyclase type 10-like n=1 Tax=Tachyglossus aculeatus TaxID=9261 RepID=UPI0018F3CDB1|nr:adenylate cyclase type 10-like [Tachyglossus aculeatus]
MSSQGRLAALLPDILVFREPQGCGLEVTTTPGVLLAAHVTGFTALTGALNWEQDPSADELVSGFDHYIGDIVEHVLCFGGDVLNITGGALLALWTVERSHLKDTITLVSKCCLELQETLGVCHLKAGKDLQLKIGLAAGPISRVVVGDEQRRFLVVTGCEVDDAHRAWSLAKANEIVLTQRCWHLCDQALFEVEGLRDHEAVKLRDLRLGGLPDFDEHFEKCIDYLPHYPTSSTQLRKAPDWSSSPGREQALRGFVMENILRKLDDGQPKEFLSEVRPVTAVFVRLDFRQTVRLLPQCQRVQEAIRHTVLSAGPRGGRLHKVFVSQNACELLYVFGLPGDKQPDEGAQALESARTIWDACWENMPSAEPVTIGVAYSPAFCGLVGAQARHEYTVIGRAMSLAARMVATFPGKVTCDEATYLRCLLPPSSFRKLPEKKLKDFSQPGPIYEYLGLQAERMFGKRGLLLENSELPALLGRAQELAPFQKALRGGTPTREGQLIVYQGSQGSGKSRLLAEAAHLARAEGRRVVTMELTRADAGRHLYTAQTLMAIFLGLDLCPALQRQQHLQDQLGRALAPPLLCLFNDLFFVKFPLSLVVSQMDRLAREQAAKAHLLHLLQEVGKEGPLVFIVDEAQYMDAASWEFVTLLLANVSTVMVMALASGTSNRPALSGAAQRVLEGPQATLVPLGALEPAELLEMACQELGVLRLPRELQFFLWSRSCGVPFYCKVLLRDLLDREGLLFHSPRKEQREDSRWETLSFLAAIQATACGAPDAPSPAPAPELLLCTVREGLDLQGLGLPPALTDVALARLDRLTPAERMLVKCAAVGGHTFPTALLQPLLPASWTEEKRFLVLEGLLQQQVFQQFGPREGTGAGPAKEDSEQEGEAGPGSGARPPRPAVGLGLRFSLPLLREAAHSLWPQALREALHWQCAHFLQGRAHRCPACAGEDFVPFHRFAATITWIPQTETADPRLKRGARWSLPPPPTHVVSPPDSEETMESFLARTHPGETPQASSQESSQCSGRASRRPGVFPQGRLRAEREFLDRVSKMEAWEDKLGRESSWGGSGCSCSDILESVLWPLAQHCMAIGDAASAFYYLLESAAASLDLSDHYMAFFYLKQATYLRGPSPALFFLWKPKLELSQFEETAFSSLRAEVCFSMGQPALAGKLARQALQLLRVDFPWTWLGATFQAFLEKQRQPCPQSPAPLGQGTTALMLAELQQRLLCLALLRQLHGLERNASGHRLAELAALMQVNAAEELVNKTQVVSAYVAISQLSQSVGRRELWLHYEALALQWSGQCSISREGRLAIAQLLQALAHSKACLGHLDLALHLGFQAHTVCARLQRPSLECSVLSVLFRVAFLKAKFGLCVRILERLGALVGQWASIPGLAVFYSACLDLLLDGAGWEGRPLAECLRFVQQHESSRVLASQTNVMLAVHSSLATWFARHGQWANFEVSFSKAQKLVGSSDASLAGSHGFARFLECQVLALQKGAEDAPQMVLETPTQTLQYFQDFFTRCSTSPIYHTHVHRLQASVRQLLHAEGERGAPGGMKETWTGVSSPGSRGPGHPRLREVDSTHGSLAEPGLDEEDVLGSEVQRW